MTDPVGVELLFLYCDGVLFNPTGLKFSLHFTTGFGLRPSPVAIIVMTPLGSGSKKL